MTRAPHIFGWLDAVKADHRLQASSSCFKVAYQLSNRTNAAEYKKSGRLITWQSIPTLAGACGLKGRMVRYAVRRLEAAGHLAIETGHGPRRSNRYTPILQKRQSGAAIADTNSGTGVPPNFLRTNSKTCARAREPRCPDGLGPLGDALRKRIGSAMFEAWLVKGEAEMVSQTADTVTLAVKSHFFAEQIRNRFDSDILVCLPGGASLKLEVREPAP